MSCNCDENFRCERHEKEWEAEAIQMKWEFERYTYVDDEGKRRDVRDVYRKEANE